MFVSYALYQTNFIHNVAILRSIGLEMHARTGVEIKFKDALGKHAFLLEAEAVSIMRVSTKFELVPL